MPPPAWAGQRTKGKLVARLPAAGRTTAVIIAIALAAVATFAIYTYVDNADDRAREEVDLVEVFRATGIIRAGTTIEAAQAQGLIERSEELRVNLPADAVGQLGDIADTVAVTDILPNDIIRAQRWGAAVTGGLGGVKASLDRLFEEDGLELNAISVRLGVVEGVAGFINPGDHVSVIVHYEEFANLPGQPPIVDPAGDDTAVEELSRFLVQDLEVLQVGQRIRVQNQQGGTTDSVQISNDTVVLTLAVTEQQAEQLVFGTSTGTLYATLLPEDFEPQPTPGRRFRNLFS